MAIEPSPPQVIDPVAPESSEDKRAGPVMIEVRNLSKSFRIPEKRDKSTAERVFKPFSHGEYRELQALRDISFEVHKGEFFGIVGRNGSGKSTLLKLLSSIYRPDAGTIRMAGRLAPFIELGVGFNAELTARENVALNGVMMGLSRRDAAHRLDSVLDFAGLREFVDLKLKNYSSGMSVRLAFASMVEADADVMLVDEVLAVGDASFAQKCMDVFHEKRRVGKTLVLVTHDMAAVEGFCDRAMLIHDGDIRYLGDPEETAKQYLQLNFGTHSGTGDPLDEAIRVIDAWFEDDAGKRTWNLRQYDPVTFHAVLETRHELVGPAFGFQVVDQSGTPVFGFGKMWAEGERGPTRIGAGREVHLTGRMTTPLVAGRYAVSCTVSLSQTRDDVALKVPQLIFFGVHSKETPVGMIAVRDEVQARAE